MLGLDSIGRSYAIRRRLWSRLFSAGATMLFVAASCSLASGDPPINATGVASEASGRSGMSSDAFSRTWARTDRPVAEGAANRTWMWGPHPTGEPVEEEYADAPGGHRVVQYYDKSRMEITDTGADPGSDWYVTNGLLVVELVTGRLQAGNTNFQEREPAGINVAGDPDDASAPTYVTIGQLLDAPPLPDGAPVIQRLNRSGDVQDDGTLAELGVTAAQRVTVPEIDHQVASPFWEFMNATGLVSIDDEFTTAALFPTPFYATGYPITEAYWTTIRVAGTPRDVLVQCFERRCLTYTPGNPEGWQVEAGNVGQHYFRWRYDLEPTPTATPSSTTGATATTTATATSTSTASPTGTTTAGTELVTIGPGAVDAWMRSIVRDSQDRVWIVAPNNNPSYQGTGPAELRIYKATAPGEPASFEQVSGATRFAGGTGTIPFADAAIDSADRLHVAWLDRGSDGQPVLYGVFDLQTETWVEQPAMIAASGLSGFGGLGGQGGLSLALTTSGEVRLAYCAADSHTQIRVLTKSASGWGGPVEPLRVDGAFVWHPALAAGPNNTWHLAVYDATNRRILAASDNGAGWTPARIVAEDVLGPENIDQGPALLVTPDGVPTLLYLDGESFIRIRQLVDGGWVDVPVGGDYFTHAPGLGVLADGTLLIAGHDEGWPPHGLNLLTGRPGAWNAWQPLVQIHADGSEVFRWAGAFSQLGDGIADLLFFDEDTNDDGAFDDQTLYYMQVSIG